MTEMVAAMLKWATGHRVIQSILVLAGGGFALFRFGPYSEVSSIAGPLPEETVSSRSALHGFLQELGGGGRYCTPHSKCGISLIRCSSDSSASHWWAGFWVVAGSFAVALSRPPFRSWPQSQMRSKMRCYCSVLARIPETGPLGGSAVSSGDIGEFRDSPRLCS